MDGRRIAPCDICAKAEREGSVQSFSKRELAFRKVLIGQRAVGDRDAAFFDKSGESAVEICDVRLESLWTKETKLKGKQKVVSFWLDRLA